MDFTTLLDRDNIASNIKNILQSFEKECMNVNFKKGIYIYGSPGAGKTYFIECLLRTLEYDVIKYDAGDVRNKAIVDTIACNNISNRNVLDMMKGKQKKIVILMDEIDGMNNGDKGGINALIKLIRQKKTKKQKLESYTLNPIICIGTYFVDKKLKELMKVCNTFELKTPTPIQMDRLVCNMLASDKLQEKAMILQYIQSDLRKLTFVVNILNTKSDLISMDMLNTIFQLKSCNEDSKEITHTLLNKYIPFKEHNVCLNYNDRTIVALLYHENMIDVLSEKDSSVQISFYTQFLENICFADYFDRITFQNQIWIFNEMSSLIKTFYNNYLYHKTFSNTNNHSNGEIRFTKVLTKYSTEYNNILFLNHLCQELNVDKKDLYAFFLELRIIHNNEEEDQEQFLQLFDNGQPLEKLFEDCEINKLEIKRIYRFLDKIVKKEQIICDIDYEQTC
jgi:SpoVK/Ycf46/Vps4 family AAA+-type ATPase